MTTPETLQLAAVLVAGAGFAFREYNAARIERKRSQPLVLAHEDSPLTFARSGPAWEAHAHITNEGGGNAFNVRFGVQLRGVRFAFRLDNDDPPNGNRQRVVRAGESSAVMPIRLGSLDMWNVASLRQDGKLHKTRAYWARYENASGDTWETLNPPLRQDDYSSGSVRAFARMARAAWPEQDRRDRRQDVRDHLRKQRTRHRRARRRSRVRAGVGIDPAEGSARDRTARLPRLVLRRGTPSGRSHPASESRSAATARACATASAT